MALKVRWTTEARRTYENILGYLLSEWSMQDLDNFVKRTDQVLFAISEQPYLFKASAYKNIRKAIIGRQNSLFYLIQNDEIILLSFWDNRQNPAKNKF